MSKQAGFTIIVPCYKAGEFIEEAIDSVYALPIVRPFEIIIVDDASPDECTQDALDRIKAKYPEIQVIKQNENKGVSAARNTAIHASKYDYIFPFDADDKWNDDPSVLAAGTFFDRAIDTMESDQDTLFICTDLKLFGSCSGKYPLLPYSEKKILTRNSIPAISAYRKQDAINSGGYKSSDRFEDWGFNLRMINFRFKNNLERKVIKFDAPYYGYRQVNNGENRSSGKVNRKDMFQSYYDNNPDIYSHYYPQVSPEKMASHMVNEKIRNISDRFSMAVKNPSWVLNKIHGKVKNLISPQI